MPLYPREKSTHYVSHPPVGQVTLHLQHGRKRALHKREA
jgi:hypothetical protein